ncbi:GNAT family N-acetyltransferase [Lachnospiraceae bacterium LCP25S3_G4]
MNILGKKICLRAIEEQDKQLLKELVNDSEIEYFLEGISFPVSNNAQTRWMNALEENVHVLRCMIEDQQHMTTYGTVIISDINYINGTAQIHVKLLKEFWGLGLGNDSIQTIIDYCFQELRIQCIYAYINEYNIASIRLFEKVGFKKEGILRRRIYKRGLYHDIWVYSILKEL